jgi:isopenicillin N synthase-like dioxygenase
MLGAARNFGFLYINTNNTGFTERMVDRQFDISRQFFALPVEEKQKCLIDETNRGWTGMHGEILDPQSQRRGDFKEGFNMGEFREGRPQQSMPPLLQSHVDELAEFEATCQKVCARVLDLIGLGLEVGDPKFFSSRHTQPSGCIVRMLHYPAISEEEDYQPEIDIRAGAHSDYGSITLLFQRPSQPGLEILTPENTWAPVPVIPDGYGTSKTFPPILVNIGDLLSYWTDGLLKSTVHRVIFPKEARRGGEDRYSVVYFCHPGDSTELVPVPSRLVAEHKREEDTQIGHGGGATSKRAITAKEHLLNRLEATYGFRKKSKEQEITA